MSREKEELRQRVEAKRKQLEAEVARLKANALGEKNERIEQVQRRLDRLSSDLQVKWDNLTDDVARRLNSWLKERDE